jgi:hypothetical protein
VEQHQAFLRRLMKGCLLSRKVVVLRALLNLKELALRFVKAAGEAARVRWGALEEQVEQRFLGTGACEGLLFCEGLACLCCSGGALCSRALRHHGGGAGLRWAALLQGRQGIGRVGAMGP